MVANDFKSRCLIVVVGFALLTSPSLANAQRVPPSFAMNEILPLDEFSPALLGMFRKVMEIESDIQEYATQYSVNIDLALAVCLQESGGNRNLRSRAGAQGYFQVMPATFRSLRVDTNIEAGIKYLSQMIKRFNREDYALAGYNAGPGRVRRGRPPLETLQYILSVGQYRNVLKLHRQSIRHHASQLRLEELREGDSWWTISQRVGISVLQLRMHNPFLATRPLQIGQLMSYPTTARSNLFTTRGDDLEYRTRRGDNYLHLAFILEVDRDEFRDMNDLWRLQTLPVGQMLRIPVSWTGKYNEHKVQPGEDLRSVAMSHQSTPWRIIRDNNLFWDEQLKPDTVLKVRPAPPKRTYVTHRVARGDTLGALARRYGISIRAIQTANNMGRRTVIQIGQNLRIPTRTDD